MNNPGIEDTELPAEPRLRYTGLGRPAWLLAGLGVVVLLVCGVGISYLVNQRRVSQELSSIRAAAEPVTPAELEAFYSLPPGSRDATALWLDAIAIVGRPEYRSAAAGLPLVGDGKAPAADEPLREQTAVEAFLDQQSQLLATLHEAAAIGGAARYPTHFDGDDSESVAPFAGLQALFRLLALDYELRLRQNDAHATARSVATALALAGSLDGHPTLVAVLSRIVHDRGAVDRLRRTLAAGDLSEEELAGFDRQLAAIDYYGHLHRGVLGARVMGLKTFDHSEAAIPAEMQRAGSVFFRQADRAAFLGLMRGAVAASAATDQASLRAAMGRAHQQAREALNSRIADWRYPITKIWLPSLDAFVDAIGRGTARRDLARTAVAIERFRLAHGRPPQTLGEVVPQFLPAVPDDPFDGAPLRCVATADGYRVYSVGPDGIDQGGDVDESGPSGDIVFRVGRGRGL